jgi:hypothetical protein
MRHLLWISVVVSGACGSDTPVSPESIRPDFRAEVETLFEGWFPLTPPPSGVYNACTGEHVLVSGDYHLIVRQVISSSGGSHFRVHSQVNVKGVGAVSGTEYNAMEVLNLVQQAGPTGAAVFHMSYPLRTISKGAMDNSSGEIRIQMTVNGQGEVAVDRADVSFDVCRG